MAVALKIVKCNSNQLETMTRTVGFCIHDLPLAAVKPAHDQLLDMQHHVQAGATQNILKQLKERIVFDSETESQYFLMEKQSYGTLYRMGAW